MRERILELALAATGGSETARTLLEPLCAAAEEAWRRRLREDVTEENSREALLCAAAFLGAAGLLDSRCGQDIGGGVERVSVGEVSVTTGSGGTGGGSGSAGERLRRQAERMMAPYCGGEGFAFLGVRG